MSAESFFRCLIFNLLVVQIWRPAPRPTRSCRSSGRWLRRERPPPRRSFAWSSWLGEVRFGNHTASCFLSFLRLGLTQPGTFM